MSHNFSTRFYKPQRTCSQHFARRLSANIINTPVQNLRKSVGNSTKNSRKTMAPQRDKRPLAVNRNYRPSWADAWPELLAAPTLPSNHHPMCLSEHQNLRGCLPRHKGKRSTNGNGDLKQDILALELQKLKQKLKSAQKGFSANHGIHSTRTWGWNALPGPSRPSNDGISSLLSPVNSGKTQIILWPARLRFFLVHVLS